MIGDCWLTSAAASCESLSALLNNSLWVMFENYILFSELNTSDHQRATNLKDTKISLLHIHKVPA